MSRLIQFEAHYTPVLELHGFPSMTIDGPGVVYRFQSAVLPLAAEAPSIELKFPKISKSPRIGMATFKTLFDYPPVLHNHISPAISLSLQFYFE